MGLDADGGTGMRLRIVADNGDGTFRYRVVDRGMLALGHGEDTLTRTGQPWLLGEYRLVS